MDQVDEALRLLMQSSESNYRIAQNTGITEATIGNYKNSKTKPTKANAMILLKYFSSGEDASFLTQKRSIPLIPVNAMAGFGNGEIRVLEYECEHYIVPMFQDAEFLIQVKGSSMIPKYNSGDLVACKKLALADCFFQWHKVYVLSTEQGALIKRVEPDADDNFIVLVSENEKYKPFKLHKSKIYSIAIVVGVIRME
jgi:phage repressor protein C with HTH and peptisase S24 domain